LRNNETSLPDETKDASPSGLAYFIARYAERVAEGGALSQQEKYQDRTLKKMSAIKIVNNATKKSTQK